MSPLGILLLILVGVLAYCLIRVKFLTVPAENAPLPTERQSEPEEVEEYVDLRGMIRAASSAAELMNIALNYNLDVENSAEFLKKAREFENDLAPDDWAEIYEASEEGTELERFAEERAGDALLPAEGAER